MKKLVILIVLALINFNVNANNDPYIKAMAEGMTMLASAKSPEDFLAVANKFERIAKAETEKWHPSYYASFAMIIVASNQQQPEQIDKNLKIAEDFLAQAASISPENAEILALEGFIYMVGIGADPATRGQEYSGISAAALQKAIAIEPENPRVLHLLARLSFGTAMFFGSDTSQACKMNEIAIQKFEANQKDQPENPFAPGWGKQMAIGFKNECSN